MGTGSRIFQDEHRKYMADYARRQMEEQGHVNFSQIARDFETEFGLSIEYSSVKRICKQEEVEFVTKRGGARYGPRRDSNKLTRLVKSSGVDEKTFEFHPPKGMRR